MKRPAIALLLVAGVVRAGEGRPIECYGAQRRPLEEGAAKERKAIETARAWR